MCYEYKRAVMCMQHGIALRNALFNCVFTVVTRCTLLPGNGCKNQRIKYAFLNCFLTIFIDFFQLMDLYCSSVVTCCVPLLENHEVMGSSVER
jgi:hypothetical protein